MANAKLIAAVKRLVGNDEAPAPAPWREYTTRKGPVRRKNVA